MDPGIPYGIITPNTAAVSAGGINNELPLVKGCRQHVDLPQQY